jgi:hypothetical protein
MGTVCFSETMVSTPRIYTSSSSSSVPRERQSQDVPQNSALKMGTVCFSETMVSTHDSTHHHRHPQCGDNVNHRMCLKHTSRPISTQCLKNIFIGMFVSCGLRQFSRGRRDSYFTSRRTQVRDLSQPFHGSAGIRLLRHMSVCDYRAS